MSESPFLLMKQLEADIGRLIADLDVATLETREQHKLAQLKNSLIDARLDIQDYELAETREHQIRNAQDARRRLLQIEKALTEKPMHILGTVDVAFLAAQIGYISGKLI